MNLLEHYIIEIYSEQPNEYGGVTVDLTIDCYGGKTRTKHYSHSPEQWGKEKKQGYYMA